MAISRLQIPKVKTVQVPKITIGKVEGAGQKIFSRLACLLMQ